MNSDITLSLLFAENLAYMYRTSKLGNMLSESGPPGSPPHKQRSSLAQGLATGLHVKYAYNT